jgi:hypothetical protein
MLGKTLRTKTRLMSILMPPAGDLCGTRSSSWQVKHLVAVPRDRINYVNQSSAFASSYIFEDAVKTSPLWLNFAVSATPPSLNERFTDPS